MQFSSAIRALPKAREGGFGREWLSELLGQVLARSARGLVAAVERIDGLGRGARGRTTA